MQTIEHAGTSAHTNETNVGEPLLAQAMALLPTLPDTFYFGMPKSWRDLADLLCTLVNDLGFDNQKAAAVAGVSTGVVASYRSAISS
ncbi:MULTISPECIES: hypothetical protein [unclassified Ruegeria]|uniref:hypothetical protein n=1 Tax=unclassified Ruegeria TaxID=2625375 RepID=UPI00148810B0|nr:MULTISPECIES: hypothetical protein [unclassified Ruegeria]